MKIFLFVGSRRGFASLNKLIEAKANIVGLLCLIEDPHEEQFHSRVTEIAAQRQIPIYYSNRVSSSDYAKILAEIKPDIAFVIGWRHLIPQAAYSLSPKGTLIIHDSLLPAYRGFAPMNWAIINGETKTGVTLFHIAEGVDCGPIVDQMETEITLEDTAKTLDEKIIKLYEDIIIKNLGPLSDGSAKAHPQDESKASYTCKRTPEDGQINWQQTTMQIYNQIRGLTHPFPGAYTSFRGKRIVVWEAKLPAKQVMYVGRVPGRVVAKRDGMIEVLTGDGMLQLTRLQYHYEEEKPAAEIPVSVKDSFA